MGWLKDLAKERGHDTLGALARAMHECGHWPANDTRSPRTVENKLRHADEGADTTWLLRTGRPFLRALAAVLEEDEDDLSHRLQNTRPTTLNGQRPVEWAFKMFPELRPINFDSEEPFPGVPPALLRIGGPRELRTWWVAPTGAGKTLVGQWLAARYDWNFIQAQSWADVKLPTDGRVFVELSSIAGVCVHVLQAIPSTLTICIACPDIPIKKQEQRQNNLFDEDWMMFPNLPTIPTDTAELPPEFNILHTSPVRDWGDKLIQWVDDRVDRGGAFDAEQARAFLFHTNMHSLFSTPGDLIAFLGIVEKVGLARNEVDQSEATMYMRWIVFWLKAASDRFVHDHPSEETPEFRGKGGAEILRELEMERIRRGFEPSLPEAQWCDLIPRGRAPESNLERFAELEAMGVLAESGAGRYSIQPVWLARALQFVAIEKLYDDAPNGLGSLLLYKNTSENTLRRLIQEVCAGNFRCIEASLKAGEPSTPEQMVAHDGVFRAIGVALLNDVLPPIASIQQLWVWQMRYRAQRYSGWPLMPMVLIAEQEHDGATTKSCWLFAALSISRALTKAGMNIGSSALNPWSGLPVNTSEYDIFLETLQSVRWFGRNSPKDAQLVRLDLSVYRLGAALFEQFGILLRHGRLLNLQEPDLLVALANGKEYEIPESELDSVLYLPFGLEALDEACQRQGAAVDAVLRWCWRKWGVKAEMWRWPPFRWVSRDEIGTKYNDAERLWKVVPVDVLPNAFYDQLKNIPAVWPWLTNAIWVRWLAIWSSQDGRSHDGANVFAALPESLALQAVRDGQVDGYCHGVHDILWKRMPNALLDLIDELALVPPNSQSQGRRGSGPIVWLAYAVPDEYRSELVERARKWLSSALTYPGIEDWICHWLVRVIDERSPGWQNAYALMKEQAR